jgi:hypothetical protein
MVQTRWFRVACMAILLALVGSVSARAIMIRPSDVLQRVALADGIVVGKVASIEEKTVSALQFPMAPNKVEYKIAVIQIEKAFGNIKKGKEVRVGFIPPVPAINPGPGVIRPTIRRLPQVHLVKDQEVCLFLNPHFEAPFFVATNYMDVIIKVKENPAPFDKDVADVERYSKLLADPMSGLEAKKIEDRLTTVALLLGRYQVVRPSAVPGAPKKEPIPPAESKAILMALAEADWTEKPPAGPGGLIGSQMWQTRPQNLFFRLGLTANDGWNQPEDPKKVPDAAKKWLRDNADSYRIQRFVQAKKDETGK